MSRGVSLAGTGIHGYGYYDTRTCPFNMRVSKISVPAGSGYPFLISIFYPLRILSADIRGYVFFWHPYLWRLSELELVLILKENFYIDFIMI